MVKKDYGDWYGVNSISWVLSAINNQSVKFPNFKSLVFGDGIVVLNDIKMLGIDEDELKWINSVLVMIPIRLGESAIETEFHDSIISFFD